MYPAPSLEEMKRTLEEHRTDIIGVLFAPPYTAIAAERIVPKLGYLDERTAQHIHFFCAGYGGYLFAEDIEPIEEMWYEDGRVIPWGFSQRKFAAFVTELEDHTSWEYSGEVDLILTRPNLEFRDCIVFDIEAMQKDGTIDHPSRLFETIIKYARDRGKHRPVDRLSDKEGVAILGEAAVEGILALVPEPLRKIWVHGLHYRTQDLSKV